MADRKLAVLLFRKTGLKPGALAAIGTIVAVGVAVSILPPLLSLNLSGRGVSERTIGWLVATIALSAMAATPIAPRLAMRFGTATTIAVLTPLAGSLIPLAWIIHDLRILFPLVFVYGALVTSCFVLSEYWINAITPDRRRGLVMGIYATLLSLGFATGPAIISIVGYDSLRPFVIGSLILAFAGFPAMLAHRHSPRFREQQTHRFTSFILAVPMATFGVFCFAMGESSGFAFLPLWGISLGYSDYLVPMLASAMTLGNVFFQIPLGLIADRIDRRIILLMCGLAGALGMAVAWAVSANPILLMLTLFVWGGATAGLYTVGLAHL
ncbi:MAG TPA: MFS transporter, partial [Afifellaceae bacterium]|nr:MFS transporter [Afifellaceae bacterium]